ncbi:MULTISPECIES: hypothetical protein [unclassified Haloarcula]|uniref:hypothetical protein n=1 Tax=unclassified Haloarcula TaxID=2624677 RepID=UPI00124480DB|nr:MULTISPECIES: hypothetical protein [unclassified Haloarcula]
MSLVTFRGVSVFERTTQDGFCKFSGAGEAINIEIHSDLLPVRGQNVGAWYQVDIEITSQPQGNGDISSPTMTRHELRGEMIAGGTMLGLESLSEGEFQGRIHLEPFHLSWTDQDGVDWLPPECFVTVTLKYDTGKSSLSAEDSRESTDEAHQVTAFPEFDCQVDYQGRIEGPNTELQLPSRVRDILPVNGVLVMVLDPEMNMDITDIPSLEPTRNLLAIKSGGKVAWTAQSRTDDTGVQYTYRRIWSYNGRLFCSTAGLNENARKPTLELDVETGNIIEAALSSSG